MVMERCVIYSRVSSDHQDYARQIDDLTSYAEGKYEIDLKNEVFAEKVSVYRKKGRDLKKRPKFDEMKRYVEANNIKIILMWEISRLARNAANALTAIEEFSVKGVGIYFYKEKLFSLNRDHKLTISILCSIAEKERDDIMDRVISGKKKSASLGTTAGYFGKSIPFGYEGYKAEGQKVAKLVIHKEDSEVVEQIFDWAEGKGEGEPVAMREIAVRLNSKKIQTKRRRNNIKHKKKDGSEIDRVWMTNAVSVILRNTTYKGLRPFKVGEEPASTEGGKPKPIYEYFDSPIIIEPEQWDRVQTLIRKRPVSKHNAIKYKYLLRNKITCGLNHCGRSYGCSTELRYNKEARYYRCYGADHLNKKVKCNNGQFSGFALDEGVYSLLFQHKNLFTKMKEDALSEVDIESKKDQLEYYKNELKLREMDLRGVIKAKVSSFEMAHPGRGQVEYNKAWRIALKEKESVEVKIRVIDGEIETYNKMKGLDVDVWMNEIDFYETDDFDKKREFIKKYVDNVVFIKVKLNETEVDYLPWRKVGRKEYFDQLDNTTYMEGDEVKSHTINGRDKLGFVEIYAFGSRHPLKGLISNNTNLCCFTFDWFKIDQGSVLRWDKKPKPIKQQKLSPEERKRRLDEFLNE